MQSNGNTYLVCQIAKLAIHPDRTWRRVGIIMVEWHNCVDDTTSDVLFEQNLCVVDICIA